MFETRYGARSHNRPDAAHALRTHAAAGGVPRAPIPRPTPEASRQSESRAPAPHASNVSIDSAALARSRQKFCFLCMLEYIIVPIFVQVTVR